MPSESDVPTVSQQRQKVNDGVKLLAQRPLTFPVDGDTTGPGRGITIRVGKIPFRVSTLEQAVDWTLRTAISNRALNNGISVRLANAYCVALAQEKPEYAQLMSSGGVNFPDGTPVAWFMRWAVRRSNHSPGRVRGPSFFEETLTTGPSVGLRHYFVGTTHETLGRMMERINKENPKIAMVGAYAPPFGPVTSEWADDVAHRVRQAMPDIVWVALGTPKQDFASTLLAERTGLLCIGVGAAFDFKAGTVRQAPYWVQQVGLEWLFRLASEPRRLWRRYLIGNAKFVLAALFTAAESRKAGLSVVEVDIRHIPHAT